MTARRGIKAFQAQVGKTVDHLQEESSKKMSEASKKFSEVDQAVGLTESVKALDERVGLTERATAADRHFGLSERVSSMQQEFADQAKELTEKAQQALAQNAPTQRPNILSEITKAMFKQVSSIGPPRQLMTALDPKALCFCDVKLLPGVSGFVGLTIDDAPCRARETDKAMLSDMQALLAKHEAKATFFLCTDFVPCHEEGLMNLLRDGHEVANHMGADRPYGADEEEAFEKAFLASEQICEDLRRGARRPAAAEAEAAAASSASPSQPRLSRQNSPQASPRVMGLRQCGTGGDGEEGCPFLPKHQKWFRAPHADASPQMHRVLEKYGFTNVLCDAFANDTIIDDPEFIARALLELVEPAGGSIVVIHTPEKGWREHNFTALRLFLEGLEKLGLQAVSLSGLMDVARQGGYMPPL